MFAAIIITVALIAHAPLLIHAAALWWGAVVEALRSFRDDA